MSTNSSSSEEEILSLSLSTMRMACSPTSVSACAPFLLSDVTPTKQSNKNMDDNDEEEVTASMMTMTMMEPLSLTPSTAIPHDNSHSHTTTTTTTTTNSHSHNTPWRILPASSKSLRTTNPIRTIVDPIFCSIQSGDQRGDGKDPISLALGDPTEAGNASMSPCPVAIRAVQEALLGANKAAGYLPACGCPIARKAIADFHNASNKEQVIIANGCSGALELALTALLESGNTSSGESSILLVPQPGFPLYTVIAESHGAQTLSYCLKESDRWHVDLEHVQELLLQDNNNRIRGIVINNPSNPTGAVYSRNHLQQIVKLCEQYQIPIIADEVYGDLVFGKNSENSVVVEFVPMAQVAADMGRTVPVITASGIGKQFLLPGWRVGWIVFHDNIYGSLREVHAGAQRLAQVILGASHLPQKAIPALLSKSKQQPIDTNNNNLDAAAEIVSVSDWKRQLVSTLKLQADLLCRELERAPGLHVLRPMGAMYTMIRIDIDGLCYHHYDNHQEENRIDGGIANDVDFARLLLKEENVIVLPGSCFGLPNYFRAVFCAPPSVLQEAANRVVRFCQRHYNNNSNKEYDDLCEDELHEQDQEEKKNEC